MGFERFDIQLDSSVAVFFPGQIVSGKVRIWNATSEKSFKGLFLECSGLAKVFFFIGRGKRRRKRESNEQYFSFRSCLTESIVHHTQKKKPVLHLNEAILRFQHWKASTFPLVRMSIRFGSLCPPIYLHLTKAMKETFATLYAPFSNALGKPI